MSGRAGPWGWHELERRWAARLVALAEVDPGDLVLDIGAGEGTITEHLLRAGATIVAIELHPHRLSMLRERFAAASVTVVRADAADLRLPRRPFKVVANPPFAATVAVLRRLTSPSSRLERASLVLPAWAVARWAAGRGVGGTVSKQTFAFSWGPRISAHAFRPAPPADPAILIVERARPRARPPHP